MSDSAQASADGAPSPEDVGFDEAWYLRAYPDVAQAVATGHFGSGWQHYIEHGQAEGRRPCAASAPATARAAEPGRQLKPLIWLPIAVQLAASAEQINAMLDRVRRNFEFMGEREPYWSIVQDERYLARNIAKTESEFFDSGRLQIREFAATAARSGVRLNPDMVCFELGCGVGRGTIWLAELFGRVIGADISGPHLQQAAAYANRLGKSNIEFAAIGHFAQIEALPPFDVFFSLGVLQHDPPPVIAGYLAAVLRRLKPQGVAYFQVSTYRLNYRFNTQEYLASEPKFGMPELHVMPQPYLYALFAEAGCRVVEVREDSPADDNYISHRFLIQKGPRLPADRP